MKKITLNGQDLEVFFEELDNGLKVCLIPFKDKNNYFFSYATKYGSVHLDFKVEGKNVSTVPGIAHFLEHKMFDQEEERPFEFYAKTGTECNASTGIERTRYIVYGTSNLEENLDYLLGYVNSPYFTDDNIEKEKGIIVEELNMYKSIPERVINTHLVESIFKKHPARIDIGGTVDSVKSIKKDDLYTCYNTFYQPSNMVLVVGGTFNVSDIMTLIKNNLKLKNKNKKSKIDVKKINEGEAVKDKFKEIVLPQLAVSKVAIAIKTKVGFLNTQDYLFREYMGSIIGILYGPSSIFREELYTSGLVSSFSTEVYYIDDLMIIEFNAETNTPKELAEKVINHLKNQSITEEELERNKKVMISSIVFGTDIVYAVVNSVAADLITYNEIVSDRVSSIRKMTLIELTRVRKKINCDNNTILIASPKKKNNKK